MHISMSRLSMILFCLTCVAAAQQPGTVSFNHVSTQLNIPCGPSNSKPARWTPYVAIQDNHENLVRVHFLPGYFNYGNGAYSLTYQFINGYDQPVRFEVEFVKDGSGGQSKASASYNLRTGAESGIVGSYTICKQMISVRIKSIAIGGDANAPPQDGTGSISRQINPSDENSPNESPKRSPMVEGRNVPTGNCSGSGSACLTILAVRTGTRCGSSNSLEVDIRNDSNQYLRGYVIFDAPGHKVYEPTDIMSPGQVEKGVQYVCNAASSTVGRIANVGDKSVKYPPK